MLLSAGVALVLFFFPVGKPPQSKIKLEKQMEVEDTLFFGGRILNYNPHRIITYVQTSDDPEKLRIAYPGDAGTKWHLKTNGSWTIEIPRSENIKTVYFFLVRENYPAPDHVPTPDKIASIHWTKREILKR